MGRELAECGYDIMMIQATNHDKGVHYVIVISQLRGMYIHVWHLAITLKRCFY